jgi:hypothetical protein
MLTALVAISLLGLLSSRSHSPLIAVPLGTSTMLVCGSGPAAQRCTGSAQ